MAQPRCSNCNQPIISIKEPTEPCSYCGYLEGLAALDALPEGEPAGPSQFHRMVWWMALGMVTAIVICCVWLMLRFQNSLVNMTQSF